MTPNVRFQGLLLTQSGTLTAHSSAVAFAGTMPCLELGGEGETARVHHTVGYCHGRLATRGSRSTGRGDAPNWSADTGWR
jgi:hypothetical protein